jgi:hypothetical protein
MPETSQHTTVKRRQYRIGRRCQDCGRDWKPTTTITFWVNGLRYRVCGECIRAYRRVILKPCSCERDPR